MLCLQRFLFPSHCICFVFVLLRGCMSVCLQVQRLRSGPSLESPADLFTNAHTHSLQLTGAMATSRAILVLCVCVRDQVCVSSVLFCVLHRFPEGHRCASSSTCMRQTKSRWLLCVYAANVHKSLSVIR